MRLIASAVLAVGMMGAVSLANATPIDGTFTVKIWQGDGGGNIADPEVQALPTNPLVAPGNLLGTYTYTGKIDFTTASNDILSFLLSAGGSIAENTSAISGVQLSQSNFALTTIMEFSGTTATGISGAITHDDGISLFQNSANVVDPNAAAPTISVDTAFSLAAGNFNLWYVEANNLPANLKMDVTHADVPEPASLGLLGLGVAALGLAKRRKSA